MSSHRPFPCRRLALIALIAFTALARAQDPDAALQNAVDADPWPRKVTTPAGSVSVNNNVYGDHLGNVYSNSGDSWSKWNGGGNSRGGCGGFYHGGGGGFRR